jgi:hypothetical protein
MSFPRFEVEWSVIDGPERWTDRPFASNLATCGTDCSSVPARGQTPWPPGGMTPTVSKSRIVGGARDTLPMRGDTVLPMPTEAR